MFYSGDAEGNLYRWERSSANPYFHSRELLHLLEIKYARKQRTRQKHRAGRLSPTDLRPRTADVPAATPRASKQEVLGGHVEVTSGDEHVGGALVARPPTINTTASAAAPSVTFEEVLCLLHLVL